MKGLDSEWLMCELYTAWGANSFNGLHIDKTLWILNDTLLKQISHCIGFHEVLSSPVYKLDSGLWLNDPGPQKCPISVYLFVQLK